MVIRPGERTRFELTPHPAHPHPSVHGVNGSIAREGARLDIIFHLTGNIAEVNWSARTAPQRLDELWTTTCFELFLRLPASDAYLEFNFAPSLCWAAYRFSSPRAGMAPALDIEPETHSRIENRWILVEAAFALPRDLPADQPLTAGISAVIDHKTGDKSYWALAHPGDKPDFHHPDSFMLSLPPVA